MFCGVVYGLGHTIARLFGSEQARQRAVKGARRNLLRWELQSTHSHQNKKHPPNGGCFYFAFLFADLAKKYDNGARKCEYEI